MISTINSWAQGIIVSIIIVAIIEIILPEGNNKKYVKVILGIYIMFSIIYPIVNVIKNKKINLSSIVNSSNLELESYDIDKTTLETNSYIETTYKENLKNDIINRINKEGYEVLDINIYIETQDQDMYGRINSIVLNICKNELKKEEAEKKNVNSIKEVEEVRINISKKEKIVKEQALSNDEINSLKELLYNSYSIEKTRIHINE